MKCLPRSEGGDAPTLSLPGRQNELIAAVAAANPRTVIVLITGSMEPLALAVFDEHKDAWTWLQGRY